MGKREGEEGQRVKTKGRWNRKQWIFWIKVMMVGLAKIKKSNEGDLFFFALKKCGRIEEKKKGKKEGVFE